MIPPRHAGDRRGQDRWLVSYADLATLMMAFFVTLYAASNAEQQRAGTLPSSLDPAAVDSRARTGTPPLNARPTIVPRVEVLPHESNLDDVRLRLQKGLEEDVRLHRADITRDARGVVISLPEQATFAAGSAEVTSAARDLIGRVAAAVTQLPNAVRIEGHTDDTPIRTPRYPSNWELSTARAGAVVAFLIETLDFDPVRLSAAGYGQFHPRVPNDSVRNRASNRRIDVVVMDLAPSAQTTGAARE